MDIPKVTHKELEQCLFNFYNKKLPLFIWGTFGIGKSAIVQSFGKSYASQNNLEYSNRVSDINDPNKFVVIVIPLHQYDPAEIKGIPFPDTETKTTDFYTTGLLPSSGQGIIFFDELNLAPPLVQANSYQLILDRRLGQYELPEGFVAIGAGNTIEDEAHIQDMAMPLRDRFAHFFLKIPTGASWINNYALPNNIDPRIISFLSFREDLLHNYAMTKTSDMITCATPRSWEFISKAINGIENLDLIELMVGSFAGESVAQMFVGFLKKSQSIDIDRIFTTGKIEMPSDISEIYAVIEALASYYSKHKDTEAAEKIYHLSDQFSTELAMVLYHLVKIYDEDFFDRLSEDYVKEISNKYLPYILGDWSYSK